MELLFYKMVLTAINFLGIARYPAFAKASAGRQSLGLARHSNAIATAATSGCCASFNKI
jgi:hypothetical protein